VPTTIVDRLGAGDALAAGVLCRLLEDAPLEDALRFGLALAALALSVPGDIARVSRAEVEAVLANAVDQLKR
jgi:2-dehydro-3-deoxygluconokinase